MTVTYQNVFNYYYYTGTTTAMVHYLNCVMLGEKLGKWFTLEILTDLEEYHGIQ